MTEEATVPQKIRAEIDRERPLFDFARYQITLVTWAAASAALHSYMTTQWQLIFILPIILFGVVLGFRVSMLGERLVFLLMEMVFPDLRYTHPVRIAFTLLFLFANSSLIIMTFMTVVRALEAKP